MKRFLLLGGIAGVLTIAVVHSAQAQKTYTGPFVMAAQNLNGEATYGYTDGEDGERIRQGRFSFKGTARNENLGTVTVQGSYKDGIKVGKWTTTTTRPRKEYIRPPKADNNLAGLRGEGKSVISGNYVDGQREGEWTFISGKLTDPTAQSTHKSVANFSGGMLNGAFSYSYSHPNDSSGYLSASLSGVFTDGAMDGKWTFKFTKSTKVEFIRTLVFEKGRLVSSKLIDLSTGGAADDPYRENAKYEELFIAETRPESEWRKRDLYNAFNRMSEPIQNAFVPWLGDPTLEQFDTLHMLHDNGYGPGFIYQ